MVILIGCTIINFLLILYITYLINMFNSTSCKALHIAGRGAQVKYWMFLLL